MSKYTTQLRYICEALYDNTSHDADEIESVVSEVWDKIFNNFPIFDEEYRKPLCEKILRHFYNQEIGYETVGLWKFKLHNKMNEIMPLYNQYYQTAVNEFNPFNDIDLTVTRNNTRDESLDRDIVRTGSTSNDSNTQDINKYSRTPQGGLTGLLDGSYLTEATVVDNTAHGTVSDSNNTEDDAHNVITDAFSETLKGKRGGDSYSKLLMEFRKTFLNIDMMVINELEPLFMGLW